MDEGLVIPIALTLLGALAVVRHHSNIKRLLRGEESRISFKRKRPEDDGEKEPGQ